MTPALKAWWRARTSRERMLVRVAGAIAAIAAPLWAYGAAAAFKDGARADLAAATALRADVAALARSGPSAPGGDQTLRGRATKAAEDAGLTIASLEPSGPDRVRIIFAPAPSLNVYRWIDAVGRAGAFVSHTAITRVGDRDEVAAEFEVTTGP